MCVSDICTVANSLIINGLQRYGTDITINKVSTLKKIHRTLRLDASYSVSDFQVLASVLPVEQSWTIGKVKSN